MPSTISNTGRTATGVLMGGIAYALLLAYIREGPAGVGAWFRAKFFNEVGSAAPAATTTPAAPSPTTPAPPIHDQQIDRGN